MPTQGRFDLGWLSFPRSCGAVFCPFRISLAIGSEFTLCSQVRNVAKSASLGRITQGGLFIILGKCYGWANLWRPVGFSFMV